MLRYSVQYPGTGLQYRVPLYRVPLYRVPLYRVHQQQDYTLELWASSSFA